MLLYYVTDRKQFPASEAQRRERVLSKIADAAGAGVDYIQLREKDLLSRELEDLARQAVQIVRENGKSKIETKLLINARTDIALAVGADGVHLPADDIPASDARAVWSSACSRNSNREARECTIAASCHSAAEVRLAEAQGASFAVFGPIFGKMGTSLSLGVEALRAVCRRVTPGVAKTESVPFVGMPVFAIGGVTLENARTCIEAGAAGIAAIRLFQENEVAAVVEQLRRMFAATDN